MPFMLQYANYTFYVTSPSFCDANTVNSCCDMALGSLDLVIAKSVDVVSSQVGYLVAKEV